MASEASSSSFNNVPKILIGSCSGGGGGGYDRLSDLPDAVLGSILSSFSTEEVVRTSILSPRWRYVWTSVPHIKLVDEHYNKRPPRSLENKECFRDFVDRVLRLNNVACLPKADISCSDNYDESLPEWITALTVRKIDELVLKFVGSPHIKLPHCLFMCKNLVNLNLHNHFVLDVPTSVTVSLLHLKVLRLERVQFFDENTMQNLLAGCPIIEELKIEGHLKFLHRTESTTTLYIQTSSLKSLAINHVHSVSDKTGIFIDAVNLERLNVTIIKEIERFDVHCNLSSLVSVHIDVWELSTNGYMEPLRKMSSTKYLSLSFTIMESLSSANLNNLPMFPYLTHLEVEIISWFALPHLLRCSPNLITFRLYYMNCEDEEFGMLNFSMAHLESVSMHRLGLNHQYDMDIVKYFLKYAPVLKKMSLSYSDTLEDSNLSNEILLLPRASTECELEISHSFPER